MLSTKEENLKVLFRTDKQLNKSEFPEYEVSSSEKGSIVSADVYKEDTIANIIHTICNSVDDEQMLVLLFKKYQIIIKDEDKGYIAIQKLLSPNFNAENFCLSKCSFFVDKADTYSVDIDYDFGNELQVEVSKFVENDEEVSRFSESARSILQDIIEELEVSLQ